MNEQTLKRQVVQRVPTERSADFDEQQWPVNVVLVILAGFVAGIILGTSDFQAIRPLENGWVHLSILAVIVVAFLWGATRLERRIQRRTQLGVLLSLLVHLWLCMVSYHMHLRHFVEMRDTAVEQLQDEPQVVTLPDYQSPSASPDFTPDESLETPLEAVAPDPLRSELARSEVAPVPIEMPTANEPEIVREPTPVELERTEISAPHRAQELAGQRISRREIESETRSDVAEVATIAPEEPSTPDMDPGRTSLVRQELPSRDALRPQQPDLAQRQPAVSALQPNRRDSQQPRTAATSPIEPVQRQIAQAPAPAVAAASIPQADAELTPSQALAPSPQPTSQGPLDLARRDVAAPALRAPGEPSPVRAPAPSSTLAMADRRARPTPTVVHEQTSDTRPRELGDPRVADVVAPRSTSVDSASVAAPLEPLPLATDTARRDSDEALAAPNRRGQPRASEGGSSAGAIAMQARRAAPQAVGSERSLSDTLIAADTPGTPRTSLAQGAGNLADSLAASPAEDGGGAIAGESLSGEPAIAAPGAGDLARRDLPANSSRRIGPADEGGTPDDSGAAAVDVAGAMPSARRAADMDAQRGTGVAGGLPSNLPNRRLQEGVGTIGDETAPATVGDLSPGSTPPPAELPGPLEDPGGRPQPDDPIAGTSADSDPTAGGPAAPRRGTPDSLSVARRPEAGISVRIDAPAGPGGLSDRPAADSGLPSRRARPESTVVHTNPSRLILDKSGGKLAAEARVQDVAVPGFRQRDREGRQELARQRGGSESSERAVELGLEFLARHQSPDGSWSLHSFGKGQFAQGQPGYRSGGPGEMRSSTAATGMSLLAFLGAGYTHTDGKYRLAVGRGLEYLLKHQRPDGDLFVPQDQRSNQNVWLYSHGMAAIALCEAYGMTRDLTLQEPAARSLAFIASAQNQVEGGWRYSPGRGSDTSVSGWQLMALKSGELSGLEVPASCYELVGRWLDGAQSQASPEQYVYRPRAEQEHQRTPSRVMTAEALLMRQYLGWDRDNSYMQAGADFLTANPPDWSPRERDAYYWYYATQVMFQMGGQYWDEWNGRLRPLLTEKQVTEGPLAGSWDPLGAAPDRWGREGGRIYVTAIHLLMLEVYYRHLPLYQTLE